MKQFLLRVGLLSILIIALYSTYAAAGACVDAAGNTYFTNARCPQDSASQSTTKAPTSQGVLEFRGIPMGMSMDRVYYELKEQLRRQDEKFAKLCELVSDASIRKTVCPYSNACESVFDIKGVTVKAQFGFENDILTHVKILYSPQQYETLRNALVDKYGKPTDVKGEAGQTVMGVKFDNETTSWLLSSGFVSINRYDGRINEGAAVLLGSDYVARYMHKKEADKYAPGF